jgi:hypothetical protein
MRYALPALMSLGGGAGLLPGLMAGMGQSARGREKEMEASTDWQKNKSANELKQQAMQADALKQAEANKFKQKGLDLQGARLGLERQKLNQLSNADQALLDNLNKEEMDTLESLYESGKIDAVNDPAAKAFLKLKNQGKLSLVKKGQ